MSYLHKFINQDGSVKGKNDKKSSKDTKKKSSLTV